MDLVPLSLTAMIIKHAAASLALAMVAIVTIPAALGNSNSPQTTMPEEEEVVIQIEGMTCSACATGVAASLRRVEGVIEAEVSIDPPEAHILFDPSATSTEALVEAIEDLGYEAEIVES